MASPAVEQMQQHIAQARAINDEFDGKAMPAEAARQMKAHLEKSAELHDQVKAADQIRFDEAFLAEPQYRNGLGGPGMMAGHGSKSYDFGTGEWDRGTPRTAAGLSLTSATKMAAYARGDQVKAALVGDSNGQSVIPEDFAGVILRELGVLGVVRPQATVRPTSSDRVRLGAVNIGSAGWGKIETMETPTISDGLADPPADDTEILVHDLTALVKLGEDELEDADASLAAVIQEGVTRKFATLEDLAFANGTGDTGSQPLGIARDTAITQGTVAAAGETLVLDDLRGLPWKVPQEFRVNAAYYMGQSAAEAAELLKDSDGNYVWKLEGTGQKIGQRGTLWGYPAYILEGLPAMSATDDAGAGTNASIAFGDMKAGYHIAQRRAVTVQRLAEKYIDEGKIGLRFRMRVGGRTVRPKAFATLKL